MPSFLSDHLDHIHALLGRPAPAGPQPVRGEHASVPDCVRPASGCVVAVGGWRTLRHVALPAPRCPVVLAHPRPRTDGRPGCVSRLPPRGTRHPLRTRATPVPRHRADRPRDDARARAIHAVGRARYPLGGPRPPHGHGFGTAGPRRALVWNRVRVQTDYVAVGTLPAPVVLAPAPDRYAAGAPRLRRSRGPRLL